MVNVDHLGGEIPPCGLQTKYEAILILIMNKKIINLKLLTMIHNLLKRLKPEYSKALNSQEAEYNDMVNKIKGWLRDEVFFDKLTVHQVHCLSIFTDSVLGQIHPIELLYGTHWFLTNDEYKEFLNTEVKDVVRL